MEGINIAQPWVFYDISRTWMAADMQGHTPKFGKGAMKFACVFAI